MPPDVLGRPLLHADAIQLSSRLLRRVAGLHRSVAVGGERDSAAPVRARVVGPRLLVDVQVLLALRRQFGEQPREVLRPP